MVPEYSNDMMQMLEEITAQAATTGMFSSSFSNLLSIAIYVFTALSLYTIANRRGIGAAWLAWVPVAQLWILGSISDNYHLATSGRKKVKRHLLIWLNVITVLLVIVMAVMLVVAIFTLISNGVLGEDSLDGLTGLEQVSDPLEILAPFVGVFGVLLIIGIVAIIYVILRYMAMYDIYRSCDPANATVFLVLSILFSFTEVIFLMICRNKDNGMPLISTPAEPVWSENQ